MSKFLFSMELNPKLVENYIALSDMSYERGDMEKTMQYLDKGFKINSSNQNLIFRKSKYARETKDYDLAISSLQQIKTDDKKLKLLVEKDIIFDKKYIDLPSPIKTLGEHDINVRFTSDISGSFKLTIEKEED